MTFFGSLKKSQKIWPKSKFKSRVLKLKKLENTFSVPTVPGVEVRRVRIVVRLGYERCGRIQASLPVDTLEQGHLSDGRAVGPSIQKYMWY